MPNPKRRHSKRRTSARRTHDALKTAGLSGCPKCHEQNSRIVRARTVGGTRREK